MTQVYSYITNEYLNEFEIELDFTELTTNYLAESYYLKIIDISKFSNNIDEKIHLKNLVHI